MPAAYNAARLRLSNYLEDAEISMIALLSDPNAWAALATLTAMEIVLGIDNVVFISILVSKLPEERARIARQVGLALAPLLRILFLLTLTLALRPI